MDAGASDELQVKAESSTGVDFTHTISFDAKASTLTKPIETSLDAAD